MGKIRCFLGIFASLFVLSLTGQTLAAGYSCPDYKQYTSCNSGYYMTASGPGNACSECSSVKNTTGTQPCTSRPCTITNGTCSYTGSTQTCTGNFTGGKGGSTVGTSTCTGCTTWGACTGGTINISCNAKYELSNGSCVACGTGEYSAKGSNKCSACTNKPANSSYTGNSNTNNCPWSCNSGYHLNSTGTACESDTISVSCAPGKYIKQGSKTCSTTCPANRWCTGGNYTISYTGATSDTGISGSCPSSYTAPTGSTSHTDCSTSCNIACSGNNTASCPANSNCTYDTNKTYSGRKYCNDPACRSQSACTGSGGTCPLESFSCKANFYKNGNACTGCDSGYTSPAGSTAETQCTKSCIVNCKKPTCPANADCTYGEETASGTMNQVTQTCSATQPTCTMNFTCKPGYTKSGNSCVAATYTITYRNGGGTGSDQTQSVTYKSKFTTKSSDTFTRPGYIFTSWGGSYPNPSSSYTYNTAGNTTLTAQWDACQYNPTTGKGTCDCGSNSYPNGSGCSPCSNSCSGVSGFTLGSYDVCAAQTNSVCYRNCTTSDVANSTAVTGTVTKGGTTTCKATSCAKDYYLSGSGCAACVPNATCPGDDKPFECNDGYHLSGNACEPDEYTITLKKNGGSGTVNNVTGTADATATCKHGELCNLPDGSGLTRAGYAFTGWGTSASCTSGTYQETFYGNATRYACWSQQTETCQPGKKYNGSTHVTCPAGEFCPGTGSANVGTAGCSSECPGNGTSEPGATSSTACYITCSGKTITGGKLTPVSETSNYNGSTYPACTYTATCDPGYVAQNQNSASASCKKCAAGDNCPGGTDDDEPGECPPGSYCPEGQGPQKCPDNGLSAAGSSELTDCYKTCPASITIENGTTESTGPAYHKGGSTSAGYKDCTYTAKCDENYTAQNSPGTNPTCVWGDPDACPEDHYCPEDGSGPFECPDGGKSDGGATSATQCYKLCTGGDITGGSKDPVSDKVNYNGSTYPSCTFTVTCDPGYVAQNQNSASASCKKCAAGDNCPGGTDDEEPGECPPGSYCPEGQGPQKCPDNGLSAAGASSITQCYQECDATKPVSNAVGGVAQSDGDAYHNGVSYDQCEYTVECIEGYTPVNNGTANPTCTFADPDKCPEDHYCPGDGTVHECPDGGKSPAGSTSVTQCYKIFDPYEKFENGVASAKCNYQLSSQKYDYCSIQEVKSCKAGYFYRFQNAFLCESVESGYYSPEDDVHQTACPVGENVESEQNASSYTQCHMTCGLGREDVDHAASVSATDNVVYAISPDEYKACEYTITCETGYTPENNKSENPSCAANQYVVTLDKNGGTGNVSATVTCTFNAGCDLPANSALSRPGYKNENKWCIGADGTAPCYYAGQHTTANISANGTATTLYAAWSPNVYTVKLDHQNATTNGAPDTVYLKYATGWFSNQAADAAIQSLTKVPTKTGYEFVGYYSAQSGGEQIVNAAGAFQTSDKALTFTTTEPATIYARWSAGLTHCDAGTYYSGTGTQCNKCGANHYCEGGNFETDSGTPEGQTPCPQSGLSVAGSTSAAACYKTKLDYNAVHGSGTQTCDWNTGESSYSSNCRDIVIDMCDAGYWRENADATDCAVVGHGNYSEDEELERHACPNSGDTETETAASIQECFKTGQPYTATNGSGTQRCFYSSGEGTSAIYARECDSQKIDACRAGYYLADTSDIDCSEVGNNFYSEKDDINRYECPADGKTDSTTAESILLCNKDGRPYVAEHGAGEQMCYYTSGEGDDAIYASSCEDITITSCDAGYYYDPSLQTDCTAVGVGNYSPAVDMTRYACPDEGTTETATSADVSECYREDIACTIENGAGIQTCNYDNNNKSYSLNCQTCNVTTCDEGFSLVDGECINCPEGSVCDEGEQHTCAELTDGQYTESDAGTNDVAMCYRECALAENAAAMDGRDYYGAQDTCEIRRCAAGYTLDNGQCVECPEGSFCDGETDPENPGDDVKSCADLGDGDWEFSLPGAKDESGCYQICKPYDVINGTAVPVNDKAFYPNECEYEGRSESGNPCEIIDGVCVETSCNPGYEMKDGVCEPCNRKYAITYKEGGVCQVAECVIGFHPNGDACESNTQECTVPNAVYAEKVWDFKKNTFGSCMVKECEYGFHISSNACVTDMQPCNVENGSGFKEWDSTLNDWGECIATQCNPGYTSDPSQTNERAKQCGECKNKYSVLGKLAASSYVQECEIAACMYQGELYNLENNECVPICPVDEMYEDETGTMIWDDSRKKCVRTCKDGYTMW